MYEVQISIKAEKKNLRYLDEVMMLSLKAFDITEAKKFHFALHEAVINSIQACERKEENGDDNLHVHLKLDQIHKKLEAWVSDPFGGAGNKDALLSVENDDEDVMKENGRGIMLIDHLVDTFLWEIKKNGEFIVYMAIGLE